MIWNQKPTAQALNELGRNTLGDHIGIRFTEIGDDFLRATMPVDARTQQPAGLLHGGASVALAETLGSIASYLLVDLKTHACVGLEINANHIKGVKEGLVTGTVRAFHIGRTTHVWDIRIENEAQQLVCISRLTVAVIPKRAPSA